MENQYLLFDIDRMRYAVPIKYVGYIIPATEEYPSCVPPKMPSYIRRVISIEKRHMAIIELENFTKEHAVYEDIRLLVLILNYQGKTIGLQVDAITMLPADSGTEMIEDSVNQCSVLKCGENDFVLFDVPGLFEKMG